MAEEFLNEPEVDAEFHQMGGIGMSESPDRCAFVDPAFSEGAAEGVLDIIDIGWFCSSGEIVVASSAGGRKDPSGISIGFVPISEFGEYSPGQRHISVFSPFSLLDVNDHALAVNVCNFEPASSAKPQSIGTDGE